MFISKKKFNQAIEEAKNEARNKVYDNINRENNRAEYERQQDIRINHIHDRMDKAFCDIDRRLTELENRNNNRDTFPVSRY